MQIAYRELAEGERIPRGYGIAWHRHDSCHAVCYPIPFNLALGFLRHWYFRLVQGKIWRTRGYSRGFHEGMQAGFTEGRLDAVLEMKAMKILEEFEAK